MKYLAEREEVVHRAREMERLGLIAGTSGNVSRRVPEGAVITPSSMPFADMEPEDAVVLNLDGDVIEGARAPSVERMVHVWCYRSRADVGAVVHSHPVVASAFAAARASLPSVLDESAACIGDEVRVADYAASGTRELGENAARAMGDTANAVFLAAHGLVAVGRDLAEAMLVTQEVERSGLAFLYAKVLGGAAPLPEDARALLATVFNRSRA
jgi:L-fuculose-phosphate aldolase